MLRSRTLWSVVAGTGSLSLLAAGLVVAPAVPAAAVTGSPYPLSLASVATDGTPADGPSSAPAISADGTRIVFASQATNLDANGPQTGQNAYLRDTVTGTTTLIGEDPVDSTSATQDVHFGGSMPSISPNGRYVAFLESVYPAGGGDGHDEVFVRDTTDHSITRFAPTTAQAYLEAGRPTVANDGTVAFPAAFTSPAAGTYTGWAYLSAPLADPAALTRIGSAGDEGIGGAVNAVALTNDGTVAVFYSYANPDAATSTPGEWSVWAATRTADTDPFGTAQQLAVTDVGADDATAMFGPPGLTADGATAAVVTFDAGQQISLLPVAGTDHTPVLSGAFTGTAAFGGVLDPVLSADGSKLTFVAFPPITGSTVGPSGLWEYTAGSAGPVQVSTAPDGTTPADADATGALSQNGAAIVVDSAATNLTTSWPGYEAIYVGRLADTEPPAWPTGATLTASSVTSDSVTVTWSAAATDNVGVTAYAVSDGTGQTTRVAGSATSATLTGLAPDTAYTVTVTAEDAVGNATDGPQAQVHTAVFTGVALAATATDTGVHLSWPASSAAGLYGYEIYRGPDATDLSAYAPVSTVTAYDDTDTSPKTTYAYAVHTLTGTDTDSPYTATQTVTTKPPPFVPSRLAAQANNDGTVTLNWDPSGDTSVTGYRVMRAAGTQAATTLADLPLSGGTNYQDTAADAGTQYTYTVETLAGSTAAPYSEAQTVTTPDLPVPAVTTSTSVPRHLSAVVSGSTLTVTATGQPNRTVSAVVAYTSWAPTTGSPAVQTTLTAAPHVMVHPRRLAAPADVTGSPVAATKTVPLTADPDHPGTYSGQFAVTTGIASITGVTVTEADGAGHTATADAPDFPADVTGTVHVVVDAPDGSQVGSTLLTSGETMADSVEQKLDTTGNTFDLAALPTPLSAYWLWLDNATGQQTASTSVQVSGGLTTDVTLTPQLYGTLTVHVHDAAGKPLDVDVSVLDSTGSVVARPYDSNGTATATLPVPADGSTYQVRAQLYDTTLPLQSATFTTTTLTWAGATADLTLNPLPTASVSGTVSRDGTAATGLPGATVQLSEHVDGRDWNYTATTDDTGHYTLTGLAGDGTLSASTPSDPAVSQPVTLTAGTPATADATLAAPVSYPVNLTLQTDYYHNGQLTDQPIDWTTAIHLVLRLRSPSQQFSPQSGSVSILARPGDAVQFCSNGAQIGLPYACVTGTAPADPSTPISLDLVLGKVQGVKGTLAIGADDWWEASIARLVDGKPQQVSWQYGNGPAFTLDFPEAGPHVVTFQTRLGSRSVDASPQTAQVLDLGTITPQAQTGPFANAGSTVTAGEPTVAAGETVDVRTAVHNDSGQVLHHATATLQVPAYTTLGDSSVLLDGKPVPFTTVDGDHVQVAIGDLPAGGTAVVHQALAVDPSAPADTDLTATSTAAADGVDPTQIGSAGITVGGLTLDAPLHTQVTDIHVSGRAPAGLTVTVSDGDARIGTFTASAGGYWDGQVTLASSVASHQLTATAVVGAGVPPLQASAPVHYDPQDVVITNITIRQPDGRQISWDPRQGSRRFGYIWRPQNPYMIVDVTFSDPARATNVVVHVGDGKADAAKSADGVFEAKVKTDLPTDFSVDYDVLPAVTSWLQTQDPTPAQVNALLPDALTEVTNVQDTATATGGTVSGDLPGLTEDGSPTTISATFTVSDAPDYQPSAADQQLAAEAGSPLLGQTVTDSTRADGSIVHTVTMYLPVDTTPTASPSLAGRAHPAALAAPRLAGTVKKIEETIEVTNKIKSLDPQAKVDAINAAAKQLANGAAQIPGLDPFTEKTGNGVLDQMVDYVDKQCSSDNPLFSGDASVKGDLIDKIKLADFHRTSTMGLKAAANFVAGKLSPGGAVEGAVMQGVAGAATHGKLTGVTQVSDLLLDAKYQDEVNALSSTIMAKCPPPPHGSSTSPMGKITVTSPLPHHHQPVGSSTPAIDPSGYVYEAVPSNRLANVTATIEYATSQDGKWTVWDGSAFGEDNPVQTDPQGAYHWDVPVDWWKVVFTKDGYRTAETQPVHVLPAQYGLNVALVSLAAPTLAKATSDGATVTLTFDKYMTAASVPGQVTVSDAAGKPVTGTVTAVDPQPDPTTDGQTLARTFTFTPAASLAAGTYTVQVGAQATTYAGSHPAAPLTATVTVSGPRTPGGAGSTPPAPQPPTPPTPPAPPAGTTDAHSGASDSAFGTATATSAHTTVVGHGLGAVTVGQYAADPEASTPPSSQPATYFDVRSTGFTALAVTECNVPAGHELYWWTGSAWQPVQPQTRDDATGCLTATLSGLSSPGITELSGTPFAVTGPPTVSLTTACPAGTGTGFADLAGSFAQAAAACLTGYGIAKGETPTVYGPGRAVTRGQMALFLARLLTAAGVSLPTRPAMAFTDVDPAGAYATAVNQLAAVLAVRGSDRHAYHPGGAVTREQMAAFLVRAYRLATGQQADISVSRFSDVPADDPFVADIAALTGLGITAGVAPATYGPGRTVTRAEMAEFLARTLSLLVAAGKVTPVG